MKITKEQIKQKIILVYNQYSKKNKLGKSPKEIYIPILQKIEEEFFSQNSILQVQAIEKFKSLLLTIKVWEPLDIYISDKHHDAFIDNFNNFNEFYEFLIGLVKDVEEYHKMRLETNLSE